MKDLHPSDDGETYFELVAGFVHRRIGAHEFIPQFFRLRHRDDTIVMPGVARTFETAEESVLRDVLDSIDSLCSAYTHALPDGGGHLSEEKFRQVVQSIASTSN